MSLDADATLTLLWSVSKVFLPGRDYSRIHQMNMSFRPKCIVALAANFLCLFAPLWGKTLNLPPRAADALTGHAFAAKVSQFSLQDREEAVSKEVMAGNVPWFWRELVPITVTESSAGKVATVVYSVTPDYLAIGSDDDYLLMPLTPFTAQQLADQLKCSLPTPKMVNQIYSNAIVKLVPQPMDPGSSMVNVPAFLEHNDSVRKERDWTVKSSPLGALTAGHKKDVVICNKLQVRPGKVAIYGWHKPDGLPIQPLFTGHAASWADYSHGIRFIDKAVTVNGETKTLEEVLADPATADLLTGEGVMTQPRYVLTEFPAQNVKAKPAVPSATAPATEVKKSAYPDEEVTELKFDPEVRIQINAPAKAVLDPKKKLMLIFFALPNGNTIEQTVGKQLKAGDDWRFDIQHIGAQTRFLREKMSDCNVVVAYLESELKSWPAWRKKNGDASLPKIIGTVKSKFSSFETRVVLSSHSGGGSFIFGYLNTQDKIPADIDRIAFLDSNYGYDSASYHEKLATWLKASDRHCLSILAYHDDIALLDGKTFVSAEGGTWGKSHLMITDFEKDFNLTRVSTGNLEKVSALEGQLQFLLMENPEKKVLHTVQVERNGFIQAILGGTSQEDSGYEYFGDRVYSEFISKE
jgi:hypothetical protein